MPNDDITHELLELLRQGKKIKAISLYRQHAGIGLKEAKDYIDGLESGGGVAVPLRMPTASDNLEVPDDVLAAVQQGNKIEAIKRLRNHTGGGLKETKDIVDALMKRYEG